MNFSAYGTPSNCQVILEGKVLYSNECNQIETNQKDMRYGAVLYSYGA